MPCQPDQHDFQPAVVRVVQQEAALPMSEQVKLAFSWKETRICVKCGTPEYEQQLAQARDMFKRLLRWLEEGRFGSMENQHLQIHWLNEIRAFLASLEATDGR